MIFTETEKTNFNHIINDYTAIYLKIESILLETTELNKKLIELQTEWNNTNNNLILENITNIETKLNEFIKCALELEKALLDLKIVENTMFKHLALKHNVSTIEIQKNVVAHLNKK